MSETVRLGFVGAGRMGQQAHLANYVGLPGVELVALAEGRAELAQKVATHYGVQEVCASHRELCERDDIDAVVSITWFQINYAIVCDLLRAGKHVVTEKSMCVTEPAAEAMVAAAREAGKVYQISYMKRFDPGVQRAKQAIADLRAGDGGEPRLARIWCSAPGDWTWQIENPIGTAEPVPNYDLAAEPPQPGATKEQHAWVQGWLNYYSHQTNLLRYVLGEDYEVAYHDAWSGGDVVVGRTPSGMRVLLEFHKFRAHGWDEGFDVVFADGSVHCRLPAPLARQQSAEVKIVHALDHPRVEQPTITALWGMGAQARAFIAAVRGEGPELSPPAEAAKEVTLAWHLVKTGHGA